MITYICNPFTSVILQFYTINLHTCVNLNEVVFFLLSFSDLSHHHACGSARGGSLFRIPFEILVIEGWIPGNF